MPGFKIDAPAHSLHDRARKGRQKKYPTWKLHAKLPQHAGALAKALVQDAYLSYIDGRTPYARHEYDSALANPDGDNLRDELHRAIRSLLHKEQAYTLSVDTDTAGNTLAVRFSYAF